MDARPLASGAVVATTTSSVASRFVSQTQLTEAQKKREQDLKEAYARIGQEPPPTSEVDEQPYDPRSLFERLKANRDAKQEEWDERMRLSNQFRGIDASEVDFLNDVAKQRAEEERKKRELEQKELEAFKRMTEERRAGAVGAAGSIPTLAASPPPIPIPKATGTADAKGKTKAKRKRDLGLGIVRKSAPAASSNTAKAPAGSVPKSEGTDKASEKGPVGKSEDKEEKEPEPQTKKPKTDTA